MLETDELSDIVNRSYPVYHLFDNLIFKINRLSNAYSRSASRYYQLHFGIGVPEVRLINIIGHYSRLAQSEVAERSSMDKALVSRGLSVLMRRGYVRKTVDEQDRRRVLLHLTATGAQVFDRVLAAKRERHMRVVRTLTPDECRTFYALLDQLLIAADQMCQEDIGARPADHDGAYVYPWPPNDLQSQGS